MKEKASPIGEPVNVTRELVDVATTLKLRLEPLAGGKVRILEYQRKRRSEQRFTRVKEAEGMIEEFARLKLPQSYEELFPQATLFEEEADAAAAQ